MKLKPIAKRVPPRELKLRLDGETHQELAFYAELYEAEYGEAVDVPKLAMEILRQFLKNDRAFRSWKKRRGRAGGRADGPATRGSGGKEGA